MIRTTQIREGELRLKVSANTHEDIEVFLDNLDSFYTVYQTSAVKANDRSKGYHIFAELSPRQEGNE